MSDRTHLEDVDAFSSVNTLLEYLDKAHPPRFPRKGEDPERWQRAAGKRELVDELLAMKAVLDE